MQEERGRLAEIMLNRELRHPKTPEHNSKKITLEKVFDNVRYQGADMEYEYDFGDSWTHQIEIVGRGVGTKRFECLDGEGHGAGEDVGSWKGWLEYREAYRTTTPGEEQEETRKWYETMTPNGDRRGLGMAENGSGTRRKSRRKFNCIEEIVAAE